MHLIYDILEAKLGKLTRVSKESLQCISYCIKHNNEVYIGQTKQAHLLVECIFTHFSLLVPANQTCGGI